MTAQIKWLIAVQGPTASGKTDVAIKLANEFQTEIISCDARQFFKELKIGAAPPSANELKAAKHHFIQHKSVAEKYNAGQFERGALLELDRIFSKNNVAILVGGSGMYADAVLKGLDDLPPANENIRAKWQKFYDEKGLEMLQKEVKKRDLEFFAKTDVQNPVRLIRALEVIEISGNKFSDLRQNEAKSRPFKTLQIALDWPREQLYYRINKRVDLMVNAGLKEEAKSLLPFRHLQALNTVGYKEWFSFFDGEIDETTAIELIKQNTRRFAKRQLTWLRRSQNMHWVAPQNVEEIKKLVREKTNLS